ncbi:hypothetical protein [Methylocystis parvus]|uniref:Lipoprotein n=1 Tax=Methylocystis parvus TaxID=134 RepID=A0A6B8M7E4_9HYPH|nr:hypothetical protein [Methylocystis parvus]QGM98406.1 hypothetical protein F7D14_13580 [Methylocystis parvus]WBK01261.1 hypothetical protein MMG94_05985 [Methylocystis parvus OBBP]
MEKRLQGFAPARAARLCAALLAGLPLAACVPPPLTPSYAPFECGLIETTAVLPEFPTYSGYRWIACRVVAGPAVKIESVSVNNGKCATFEHWYVGRVFAAGDVVNIPYACMSPVSVAIGANGVISKMRLKSARG